MSTGEGRAAYIDGLQKLADRLRADESIPIARTGHSREYALDFGILHPIASGEEFAAIIRALGGEGWQQEVKSHSGSTWLEVRGRLSGLWVELAASAADACEPIEPQPVIERHCPALDALLAETQEGGTS
jgi:hypothetical protein